MEAAQSGDAHAYVQLLEEITPILRRIVRHRRSFLAVEDVEDIVQDILLSLHSVRATYEPARPFMSWLLAIARNRLADGARRYASRQSHEVHVENEMVTFSAVHANLTAEACADADVLLRAVHSLPPVQRTAIELLKLREMSLREAAAACGLSVGALKVATHRAMDNLRKALTK
jgi:RNA polymerase sigma-70 factor (ECF subfamily)